MVIKRVVGEGVGIPGPSWMVQVTRAGDEEQCRTHQTG